MKHGTVLLIKLISCMVAFAIGLDLFFDATFIDILSFSVFVTAVSYIVGDRMILPRFGNRTAIVVDFLFVYMSVWIFGSILLHNYLQIAWGSILSATIIAGAEVLVHLYVLNRMENGQANEKPQMQQTGFTGKLAYGTEFSEEQDIRNKNNK